MNKRVRRQQNQGKGQGRSNSQRPTQADLFTVAVTEAFGKPPPDWRPEPVRVIRDLYVMKMMGQLWFEDTLIVEELTNEAGAFVSFEALSRQIDIYFNEDWPDAPPPYNYEEISKLPLEILGDICSHLKRPPWAKRK